MSKITFCIWKLGDDMCQITTNHMLSTVREVTDDSCICSIDAMLFELERITAEVKEKFNAQALFEFVG